MRDDDDIERRFEGRKTLQTLLVNTGSLADVEDVAAAFAMAAKDGVPASAVIPALWEEEPLIANPTQARALFGNLLGLYDLMASGASIDLSAPTKPVKPPKTPAPTPFGDGAPDEAFVETAWRHLEDEPKVRERLLHTFTQRQDALLTWLDDAGLSDDALGLAQHLLAHVSAFLELGGLTMRAAGVPDATPGEVPGALTAWLEESVFEAESDDDAPLPADEAKAVRALLARGASALWAAGRP